MENKNMMGKMLSDDEVERATGGTMTRRNAWGEPCDKYVCKMCGSTSAYLNEHNQGCAVAGIGRPEDNSMGVLWRGANGCWSCKHAVYGSGYPADENDVWCTI